MEIFSKTKFLLLTGIMAFFACDNSNEKSLPDSEPITEISSEPVDTILKQKLEQIRIEDQTLRLLLPDVNKRFEKDSKERAYFKKLIRKEDSICINKVTNILDKHGWISTERIGYFANQTLWLVIQHAQVETQEKYLPKLRTSVENGGSEGWYLAFLEDRIAMYKEEKQIYGSQAKPNEKTGKTHIYPIRNVSKVNERRAKIGLKTIEEYAEQNGYIFDINEHL